VANREETVTDTCTIDTVAEQFDVHPNTVKRWCRDDVIEYSIVDGQRLVDESELDRIEALRSQLDSRTDRYSNLYLSVTLRQAREDPFPTTGDPVMVEELDDHGQCTEQFSRETTGDVDRSENDVTQYLERYASALSTVERYVTGDSLDWSGFATRLYTDLEALLMPLAAASDPPENLLTVVEYIERLLEGDTVEPSVIIRTKVIDPGKYRGPYGKADPATLETDVSALSITDSEAISIPKSPPAASLTGDEFWLERWQSEAVSLVDDPAAGDVIWLALIPTPVSADRFEFRTAVERADS
jgi:hypothetical protein